MDKIYRASGLYFIPIKFKWADFKKIIEENFDSITTLLKEQLNIIELPTLTKFYRTVKECFFELKTKGQYYPDEDDSLSYTNLVIDMYLYKFLVDSISTDDMTIINMNAIEYRKKVKKLKQSILS